MHLLVLITLYKCVHAYLEKYPDKMYNDVFPWTVKSVLNSPAHCFAHSPLFVHTALKICLKYHASGTQTACAAL